MMTKLPWLVLAVCLVLCACEHHRAASQAPPQPVPLADSAYTGLPAPAASPAPPLTNTPAVVAAPSAIPTALAPPPEAAQPPSGTTSTDVSTNVATAPLQTPPPEPPPTPAATESTTAPDAMPATTTASQPAGGNTSDNSSDSSPGNATTAPPPTTPADSSDAAPQTASAALTAESKNMLVSLETSVGRIVIELDDFAAPKTCKNFRQLIQDGFYNHTVFHRVIPNFVIQGGDPNSKSGATDRNTYGQSGPGYTLPPEIKLKHDRGAVAMARLPDSVNPSRESNGSQFYICLAPAPTLDGQYTVFGHVIQGMDVADKIAEAPRDKRDNPLSRIEMMMSLKSRSEIQEASPAVNQ